MDFTCILQPDEIAKVVAHLKKGAKDYPNTRRNLVVFRLSCCCGLRASEICGLDVRDVIVSGPKPAVRVRLEVAKGKKKARKIPLSWDTGTLDDIRQWLAYRRENGAGPDDPLVCGVSRNSSQRRRYRTEVADYWKAAIRCLGPERVSQLSIHKGRHTFCSYVTKFRGVITARDVAGHSNISTTNIYLHALEEETTQNLFG